MGRGACSGSRLDFQRGVHRIRRLSGLAGRGNSSVGRARPCQGRGREFESRFPLQIQEFDPVRHAPQVFGTSVNVALASGAAFSFVSHEYIAFGIRDTTFG